MTECDKKEIKPFFDWWKIVKSCYCCFNQTKCTYELLLIQHDTHKHSVKNGVGQSELWF